MKNMLARLGLWMAYCLLCTFCGSALATSDVVSCNEWGNPRYAPTPFQPQLTAQMPRMLFDEGHHNYYTVTNPNQPNNAQGKFVPFAKLATADGYIVETTKAKFTNPAVLRKYQVIVLAGALAGPNWFAPQPFDSGRQNWNPEVGQPSYTKEEVLTLVDYVKNGGSLFIISNHAPLTDPFSDLLAEFKVDAQDSFVWSLGVNVKRDHILGKKASKFTSNGGGAFRPRVGSSLVEYGFAWVQTGENLPLGNEPPGTFVSTYEYGLPAVHTIDTTKDLGWKGGGRIALSAHGGDFTSKQEYCNGAISPNPPDLLLVENQDVALTLLRYLAGAPLAASKKR